MGPRSARDRSPDSLAALRASGDVFPRLKREIRGKIKKNDKNISPGPQLEQETDESRAAKSKKSQKKLENHQNFKFPKTISTMFLTTLGMYTGPEMIPRDSRETFQVS